MERRGYFLPAPTAPPGGDRCRGSTELATRQPRPCAAAPLRTRRKWAHALHHLRTCLDQQIFPRRWSAQRHVPRRDIEQALVWSSAASSSLASGSLFPLAEETLPSGEPLCGRDMRVEVPSEGGRPCQRLDSGGRRGGHAAKRQLIGGSHTDLARRLHRREGSIGHGRFREHETGGHEQSPIGGKQSLWPHAGWE